MSISYRDNIVFKYFVYGYLNEKMVTRMQTGNSKSLKSYKKTAIVNYLKLEKYPHVVLKMFVAFVEVFELPLSLLIETFFFLFYFCSRFRGTGKVLDGEMVFLGTNQPRFRKILSNAGIPEEKIVVVTLSMNRYRKIFDGLKQIPIIKKLSFFDVWNAYLFSMRLTFFMRRKYGNDDMFFRSYSSFEFFLAYCFFCKLDLSKSVVYVDTYNRLAFIYGHLPHNVLFLQHGIIGKELNFLKKIGAPNEAYYLNKDEEMYCCKYMFNKNPVARFLKGLVFTPHEKMHSNNFKDILFVCHVIYFDVEEKLIRAVSDLGKFNIFIKPHPLDPRGKYVHLCDQVKGSLLERNEFPKVDLVIGYNSTLSVEYADAGVEVLRYDLKSEYEIIKRLSEIELF